MQILDQEASQASRGSRLRNYFQSQVKTDENSKESKQQEFNPYGEMQQPMVKKRKATVDQTDDDEDDIFSYLQQLDDVTGRKEQLDTYHKMKGEFRKSLHKQRTSRMIDQKRKTSSQAEQESDFKLPQRFNNIKIEPLKKPWEQGKFESDAKILDDAEKQVNNLERIARDRAASQLDKPKPKMSSNKTPMKSRRTNLKFDFDPDESDAELPSIIKPVRPQITGKEYLKLFKQKNQTHDADRERAVSITQNLCMPSQKEMDDNPIFNKDKKLEKQINLHVQDLYSIGQVQQKTLNKSNSPEQYDDERFKKDLHLRIKKEEDTIEKMKSYLSKNDRSYMEDNQDLVSEVTNSKTANNDEEQYDKMSPLSKKTHTINSTSKIKLLQAIADANSHRKFSEITDHKGDDSFKFNVSKLTKEVQKMSNIKLKKAFHDKVMEMNNFKKQRKLQDFDSNTVHTRAQNGEVDENRIIMKEQLKEGENYFILDKNIEYSLKMPAQMKQQVKDKFNISQKEIEPFFNYERQNSQSNSSRLTEKEEKPQTVNDLNFQQYLKQRDEIKKNIDDSKSVYKVIQDHLSERSSRKNSGGGAAKKSTIDYNDLSSMGSEYPYFPNLQGVQIFGTPTITTKKKILPNKQPLSQKKDLRGNSNQSAKNNNVLFKEYQNRQKGIFNDSKNNYNDHYKNSDEQCTLEQLEAHNKKLKELNKIVKDKIGNQIKEVEYDGVMPDNLNYFELYKSEFDSKAKEWCENEVKELTYEYQKMNFKAIKKDRRIK